MGEDTNNVIKYNKAIYPRFELYNKRVQTFLELHWPVGLAQKPEALAEAGFYYVGHSDRVCCFHCGGSLHQWLPNDIPWEEHAKSYSYCTFLNLMKSPEYVRRVNRWTHFVFHHPFPPSMNNVDPIKNECIAAVNDGSDMKKPKTIFADDLCKLLSEKSIQLRDENRKLKEERLCKICSDRQITIVLLPCGHFVSCDYCSSSFSNCPICRTNIKEFVKTYT